MGQGPLEARVLEVFANSTTLFRKTSCAGFTVLTVDCSSRPPEQSAAIIAGELVALLTPSEAVS